MKPALAYFSLVFAVGFLLGTARVLLLAPAIGERGAELLEMPVMVLASFVAARWVVRRFEVSGSARDRLSVGGVALLLLLAAELLVVLFVQRSTLGEYLAGRDPVSGAAYAVGLILFALMPSLVGVPEKRGQLDAG